MLEYARQLGFVCQERRGLESDLAQQIYSRMSNRQGKTIKQQLFFTMSFPRQAAMELFPAKLRNDSNPEVRVWESETMTKAAALMGDLLRSVTFLASGLTRAVQPPSESVARVFSTLMPVMELRHNVVPHGAERLAFKATYVLWSNTADLNPPKDDDKREIGISPALEQELRQRVLQDVLQISEAGVPLSANW